MTPTELAIQKALEGGYAEGYELFEINPLTLVRFHRLGAHSPWTWQTPLHSILLDPKWWRALDKTEGWGSFYDDEGMPRIYSTQGWYPDTKEFSSGKDEMMWQAYQHRLIDAIQQGRSIDDFFGEILKK